MSTSLYADTILDELHHPQNNQPLTDFDVEFDATNASCGDGFKIQIKLDASKEKIVAIGWQGQGCAISTAALSRISAKAVGANISDVQNWGVPELLGVLGLTQIALGRQNCLLVGLTGIKRALTQASQK